MESGLSASGKATQTSKAGGEMAEHPSPLLILISMVTPFSLFHSIGKVDLSSKESMILWKWEHT